MVSSHVTAYAAASYCDIADLIAAQAIVRQGLISLELDGEPDEDNKLPWSTVASERHAASIAIVKRYTREVARLVQVSQAKRLMRGVSK